MYNSVWRVATSYLSTKFVNSFLWEFLFGLSPNYLSMTKVFSQTIMWTIYGPFRSTLLAMIALCTVQSSSQTFIHNAILFVDTSDNVWYHQGHWLIGTPYLLIITNNECSSCMVMYLRCCLWTWRHYPTPFPCTVPLAHCRLLSSNHPNHLLLCERQRRLRWHGKTLPLPPPPEHWTRGAPLTENSQ